MTDHDVSQRKLKIQDLNYDASIKLLWQWSKESAINLREFKELMFVIVEKKR